MNFKCNLIIDSCCDLPFDLVDRQGVQLVKFPYFFDGIETLDDLWQSTTPHEFYGRMRKGEQPTTAQASIGVLTEMFVAAAEAGVPQVVAVHRLRLVPAHAHAGAGQRRVHCHPHH